MKGWQHTDWGDECRSIDSSSRRSADDYDALLLPGGVMNPDKLREQTGAVEFVKAFVERGKPIAAICHGPWTLIEAGGVQGPQDHVMAVAADAISRTPARHWVDQEVVVDNGLVTSPQARRHSRVQSQDDRGVRRRTHAQRQT